MDKLNLDAECPKCWATADRIQVKYNPDIAFHSTYALSADQRALIEAERQPFMQRTCSRCEYSWRELPLDAQGDTGGA